MNREFIDYKEIPGKELLEKSSSCEKPFFTFYTFISSLNDIDNRTINSVLNQTFKSFIWLIFCDEKIVKDINEFFDKNFKKEKRIVIKSISRENSKIEALKKIIETTWAIPIDMKTFLDRTLLDAFYTSIVVRDVDIIYTNVLSINERREYNSSLLSLRRKLISFCASTFCVKKELIIDVIPGITSISNFNKLKYVHLNFYGVWQQEVVQNKIKVQGNYINFPMTSSYNHDSGPKRIKFSLSEENDEKTILCMVPWAKIGGADAFNLNIFEDLKRRGYKIYLISTEVCPYEARQRMEQVVEAFYDLTSFLDRTYWADFIHDLIVTKNVKLVFQLSSLYGYHVLPWLKYMFPKIPFIDYLHAEDFAWRNGGFPKDSVCVQDILEKTFTCNAHLKNLMFEKMNRQVENVETLYIGVDTDKYNPSKVNIQDDDTLEFCKNKKVLLFPSRFSYEKRPIFLLHVLKRILAKRSDIVLLMVGGGLAEEDIRSWINKLDLGNNVRLIPMKSSIEEYYKMADVTVICSLSEGITLTTYESLAMNVPVVSALVGGQGEVVTDDVGATVKPYQNIATDLYNFDYDDEEVAAYTKSILNIIDNKEKYTKDDKCRNYVIKNFGKKQLYETINENISHYISTGSKLKALYSEEFAVRYLVLFNESSKEYYNNAIDYESFKNNMRQRLWKHWWWRSLVKVGKKFKVDVFIKKKYFKEK